MGAYRRHGREPLNYYVITFFSHQSLSLPLLLYRRMEWPEAHWSDCPPAPTIIPRATAAPTAIGSIVRQRRLRRNRPEGSF